MKIFILVLFIFQALSFSQNNSFLSSENRREFAIYLHCEKDYYRAALEFDSLYKGYSIESDLFRAALSYELNNDYSEAITRFSTHNSFSSKKHIAKIHFINKNFSDFENYLNQVPELMNDSTIIRLNAFKSLYLKNSVIDKNAFFANFPVDSEIENFYNFRIKPNNKSPFFAALLSSILPGAGKFYTGNWGDGVMALVATSLFGYLAIDNFHARHYFRSYLFTGIGVIFYFGNIYGSYSAAQIYNAKEQTSYNDELDNYLNRNNFFFEKEKVCK